jgi:AraC-like DNA-binding protein
MDVYAEKPLRTALLRCAWSRRVSGASASPMRIVPDACVDVMWHRESGRLFVAGPDTRAHVAASSPGEIVGVRFHTGCSPAALGVPADALRDERVGLAELWPGRTERLAEDLAAAPSTEATQAVLGSAVLARVRADPDPAVPALLTLARGGTRVGAIADAIGLTERQLHRRCLAAFGYGAKVLQRVLRFDRAIRLALDGARLADVAYRAGYADQAHLSREVRALAGLSPSEYLGDRAVAQDAEVTR